MREVEKGMKEYTYEKEVDPTKLMEGFYKSIPNLTPEFKEDKIEVHLRVFTNSGTLILWVDEDISVDEVDAVVEMHTIEEISEGAGEE